MQFLKVLFSFQGRITRAQYWLGALVPAMIFGMIIFGSASSLIALYRSGQSDPAAIAAVFGKLLLPTFLGMFTSAWISAALYTKRLHDRGKRAIWLLAIYVPAFLPLISLIYAPEAFSATGIVSMIANLWVFVELGCMRGTDGPNRFDADPPSSKRNSIVGSWDTAEASGQGNNLGGMAAAMASIEAAARENRTAVRADLSSAAPQFGQRTPQQFGRMAPSASGGFGRKV